MIVITRYAEQKLLEHIKKAGNDITAMRCVFFHLADAGDEIDKHQNIVVNSLSSILKEEESYLFFCVDGDIFVLCPGARMELLETVEKHLTEFFPGEGNTGKIYDLSVHEEAFRELCARKAEEADKKQQQREEEGEKPLPPISVDRQYALAQLEKRKQRKETQVLLVEDDVFTLKLVGNVLKEHVLIKAMDGFDAIETYMLNAPDIMFLDIGLPTVDGHGVLKKIREFDPDAFVVMLTGSSHAKDVKDALAEGAKGYIVKPFSKEKILQYVQTYRDQKS